MTNLLPQHLLDLRRSGLSDLTIAAAGTHSLTDPAEIRRALNWTWPAAIDQAAALGPCLAFPFLSPAGQPIADYIRLKPDNPRAAVTSNRKIKYESPVRKSNHAYFPPAVVPLLTNPSQRLLITEGEKKALCATQHGLPCIGLVGVWGWQQPRDMVGGIKVGERRLIMDLHRVRWRGREVCIIFDSDAADNPDIQHSERCLSFALRQKGAHVSIARIPCSVPA